MSLIDDTTCSGSQLAEIELKFGLELLKCALYEYAPMLRFEVYADSASPSPAPPLTSSTTPVCGLGDCAGGVAASIEQVLSPKKEKLAVPVGLLPQAVGSVTSTSSETTAPIVTLLTTASIG